MRQTGLYLKWFLFIYLLFCHFLLFSSIYFSFLYFVFSIFSGTFMRTLHIGSYALLYSAFYYCQSFSRSVHAYALLYSAFYYCQSFSRSVHAFFVFLIKTSISGEEWLCPVFERFNQFQSVESLLVVYVTLFAVIS